MLGDKVDDLYTLTEIAEILQQKNYDITYKSLNRSANGSNNGFPKPGRVLGIYKFYDVHEVEEWLFLWLRATKNMRGHEDAGTEG